MSIYKRIVAMILVLAFANPFCCCYSIDSESTSSTPGHSCCSSQEQSSDEGSEEGGEDPIKQLCSCNDPVMVTDDVDHFKVLRVNIEYIATVDIDHFDVFEPTASSVSSNDFLRLPPPQGVALYKQLCVYRT